MRLRTLIFCLALALAGMAARGSDTATDRLPSEDGWRHLGVQRIRALLDRSTLTNPVPVRVLFYGQSIVMQQWWVTTMGALGDLYPRANLVISNRAILGFNADELIKTAETDVYPFRPDLLIFQCYGPYGPGLAWERLMREFRARTTADVILLGNHPTRDADLAEPTDPALVPVPSEAWLNTVFSDRLSRELGLCFPDNRTVFKAYLRARNLPPSALLYDGLHLTLEGSDVQFSAIRPFLRSPRLIPPLDPFNNGRVSTWPVGRGDLQCQWRDGKLRFEFVGNRIDAIAVAGTFPRCQVRIDGQPPTALPSGRGHRRTGYWKGTTHPWPAILRVGATKPLLLEFWTVEITAVDPQDPTRFRFSVRGSETGPDGDGESTALFVSNSGRVRIAAEDWNRRLPEGVSQLGTLIQWRTEDRAVDQYAPVTASWMVGEIPTTLINDLPDGPHVLELTLDDPGANSPLVALRVYHPAGSLWEPSPSLQTPPMIRMLPFGTNSLVAWPERGPEVRVIRRTGLASGPGDGVSPLESWMGLNGTRLTFDHDAELFQMAPP